VTYVDVFIGKVQIVLYIVLGIFLVVSITSYLAGNQEQYNKTIDNTAEMITDVSPHIIESAQTVCNLDEIIISAIDASVIDEPMLGGSTDQTNQILAKWAMTERVETCEVVLLNELLSHNGIENDWRTKLGIKNSMRGQVCTAIQCFEEKGLLNYLVVGEDNSEYKKEMQNP